MMTRQQLELGIESTRGNCRAPQRRRRVDRARWWFAQMRRAVNEAPDSTGVGAHPTGALPDAGHN